MNIKNTLAGSLAALTIASSAGMGLLAAPAPAAAATTGSSCYAFVSDLTMGSTGEAVRALQVYLNNKGYLVATAGAGSKGNESTYFGGLTQTALAKYQVAMGISPAAGYFGPITRAKVNADCAPNPTPNPNPNPNPSDDVLHGDEANLSDFSLRREQSSGAEGEAGVEVATAEFDVEDGDIRIGRIDLLASSTESGLNQQPWRYFDAVTVTSDGDEIVSEDVDSRADWRKVSDGVYRLSLSGLDGIVRMDDRAELTFAFDVSDSIDNADLAQSFVFSIEDRGIRAVDAAGIQQYVGDDAETVEFGFDAEENGKLVIGTSDEDPDASILVADADQESDEYDVFAFDLKNSQDADALVTDIAIAVDDLNPGVDADDVIRRAVLVMGSKKAVGRVTATGIEFERLRFALDGDDEESFELRVTLARNATTTPISFSVDAADIEAEGTRSGDDAVITGSADSAQHQIALAGIGLKAVSTAQNVVVPGGNAADAYGQYTIKFQVTGIEDDAYIASTTAATGTVGVTYAINGTGFAGTENAFLSSTAPQVNGFYRVREGRTETFTLTVVLDPSAAGTFEVRLGNVRFNDVASFSGSTVFAVDQNNGAFRTSPVFIPN